MQYLQRLDYIAHRLLLRPFVCVCAMQDLTTVLVDAPFLRVCGAVHVQELKKGNGVGGAKKSSRESPLIELFSCSFSNVDSRFSFF